MASIRAQLAAAVVDEINAHVALFAPATFVAQRTRVPVHSPAQLTDLHVLVMCRSVSRELASRSGVTTDVQVDVAVQQRVAPEDNDQIDALEDLVERLIGFFDNRRLAGYSQAIWTSTENELLYIPEHMDRRVFSSVITVTYRVVTV